MKTRTSFDQSILGFLNPWTGAESDATYCRHSNTRTRRTQETCWLHHRRPRHRQRHGRTVDIVYRFSTLSWMLTPHIMPPALAGPQIRLQIGWPSRCLLQSWLTPARAYVSDPSTVQKTAPQRRRALTPWALSAAAPGGHISQRNLSCLAKRLSLLQH